MKRFFLLAILLLAAAVTVAQEHRPAAPQETPNPPAGSTQATPAEHATPESHGPEVGEHHEKPFLLFGRWHIPEPLLEVFRWTNFLVLFGFLLYLLRSPARDFFVSRRAAIIEGLEAGRRASAEAADRVKDVERRLDNLEAELASLRSDAIREAQAEAERLRAGGRVETERIFAAAEQAIRAVTKAARNELRTFAADLSVQLAEQRVRERLTPQKQRELLDSFTAGLTDGRQG